MSLLARAAAVLTLCAPAVCFSFISLGDWGDTEAKDYGVNTVMGTYADTLDAMFVLAIGDNMYDTGVTSVDDPQFQSKFEESFTAESLNIPWYVVGGNHDYYGSIDAQIQYSDKSYRWIFPDYYYSQTVTGDDGTTALLVGIDTWRLNGGDTYVSHDPVTGRSHLRSRALVEADFATGVLTKGTRDTLLNNFAEAPPEADGNGVAVSRLRAGASHAARGSPSADSAQLAWIESTLAASDADWKIVFGHFPVHSATTGEHGDTSYLLEALLPILTEQGVDAYFSGHDHILQHIYDDREGPTHFFGSGAGARSHSGVNDGYTGLQGYAQGVYGFMVHKLSKDAFATTFVTAKGGVADEPYSYTITKDAQDATKAARLAESIRGGGKRGGQRAAATRA